jgi:hypothetical protein
MPGPDKHNRFFRRVYDFASSGNSAGSVVVRIVGISTMFATKAFRCSFTLPKVIDTHLRSVSGRYYHQFKAVQCGFERQVATKLAATPAVQFYLSGLIFWFCCFRSEFYYQPGSHFKKNPIFLVLQTFKTNGRSYLAPAQKMHGFPARII